MAEFWDREMRKGVVELIVLTLLKSGEAYGYELKRRIVIEADIEIGESTLYLLLGRLEKERAVTVRTAQSEAGRTRRYYSLTVSGAARLTAMADYWLGLSNKIAGLLKKHEGACE